MNAKIKQQSQKFNVQESTRRNKKNYQNYINNVYGTIKQKDFYTHRSETPKFQIINNNNVSKLSSDRSQTGNNRNQALKSLPKLSVKDTISDQVLGVAMTTPGSKSKKMSNFSSPAKKPLSSSSKKQKVRDPPQLSKIFYKFGNFTQPRPSISSHLYLGPGFRQSKQLSKNSTIARQRMLKQCKQNPMSLTSRKTDKKLSIHNVNENQIPQQSMAVYQKISKDNMNLLGLNVLKMNYSQKRDLAANNRRFVYIRQTKADYAEEDQNSSGQENQAQHYRKDDEENQIIDQGQLYDENGEDLSRKRLSHYNQFDSDYCEQLISQKMQFSKRNLMQKQRRTSSINSPLKQKRKASDYQKKVIINIHGNADQQLNPIYEARYKKYLDLILKLSFSYLKYGELDPQIHANLHTPIRTDKKYKAWIGNGNNGNLLKALIKRRFWWQIVQEKSWNVNFLWTQLKNNEYFKGQSDKIEIRKIQITLDKQKLMDNSWQNLDESTCLSVGNEKDSQKKLGLGRKSRAQSSLPGTLGRKGKQSPVSKKIQPSGMGEQQARNLRKVFNRQQLQQFKRLYLKLQSTRMFNQKLQLLSIDKFLPTQCRMHNHLANNFYLGNKKALFHTLKQYYSLTGGELFKIVPLTFHIKKGVKDPQYKRFLAYYQKRQTYIKKQQKQMQLGLEQKRKMRNIWIVKPGENTNRGNGITVIDQIYELNSILKSQGKHNDGSHKTFIVQLYIDRPLLYKKRKFDIRHYMLITQIHGVMKGYWFQQGYVRTCGYEFNIEDFEREIHLTNDAVQKYTPNYGKFQPANKISYAEFQKYLDVTYPKKDYSFYHQILPKMKQICLDSIKSAYLKISPQKLEHNFQLFGMDFMIDSDFVPWLIQINTNPCLQLTNTLQSRLLPQVLDQALRLTLDVIYPPPCHYPNTYRHLVPQTSNMKAQLIFDQRVHGQEVKRLYQKSQKNEKALLQQIGQLQDDEVYEDQGQQDLSLEEILM